MFSVIQGCAFNKQTSGRAIPESKVTQIVKGKTTLEQIHEMFGAPSTVTSMGGDTIYLYKHSVSKSSGFSWGYGSSGSGEEQADELSIIFDGNTKTVKSYSIQRGIEK
jgi:outer membrane protein assembly factor BamE (lipoprotein component of BamABCDE complex)